MKSLVCIVSMWILLLASNPFVYTQTDSISSLNLKGKTAISFLVSQSFALSSFDGSLISLKRMTDNDEAWRLGVSLSGYHKIISNPENSLSYSGFLSTVNIQISGSRQLYINDDDLVRGYYGYGLLIGYQHRWDDYERDNGVTVGPIGFIGAEWFLTNRVSISGEYSTQIYETYDWNKDIYGNLLGQTHTFGITQNGVKLGVSIFF